MNSQKLALLSISALSCVLVTASPQIVCAQLYGVSPFYPASSLYRFNTSNGAATIVGSTGIEWLIGLASGPDGRFYTMSATSDSGGQRALYDVNPSTGTASFLFGLGTAATFFEGAMELNPTGTAIYAIEETNLYRIDLGLQSMTFLGTLKLSATPISTDINIDGLSFRGDTLYGLWTEDNGALGGVLNDHLISIDLASLEVTDVGSLGVDIGFTAGLAYDPGRDVFYAAGQGNPNLYSINPLTGTATLIGPHNLPEIAGLTFVAVPEPATVLIAVICLPLVLCRALTTRRCR